MRRDELKHLQRAIRALHGCSSRHFTTIPITVNSRGQIAWQGEVEVFDLIGHAKAQTCYAWSYDDNGTARAIAVLGPPPVDSAETAVKVALSTKVRRPSTIRKANLIKLSGTSAKTQSESRSKKHRSRR